MTDESIDIGHIAELCRIELTAEEKIMMAKQLETMVEYLAQLNEVDITNVPAILHPLEQNNILREDVAGENLPISDLLLNAPASKNNQITVPRIID